MYLSSLDEFVKYFFALDLHNYSGMISLHLAQMADLEKSDPDIWHEFQRGNWVVKKSASPFCALGSDEALEHQNRALKVTGGLVGITQNPNALARYFLSATHLNAICDETEAMTIGSLSTGDHKHHRSGASAVNIQDKAISKLHEEFERVGNPFLFHEEELVNISSKAVFSDEIKKDVNRVETLGTQLQNNFKSERLTEGKISIWEPIKRNKLKLCSSAARKVRVKISNTVTELTTDRSLFARLMIVTRSQRELDLRQILGKYELSAVPRSFFTCEGAMHQCSTKSKLIHILRALVPIDESNVPTDVTDESGFTVAVVDGMAELQALSKTSTMRNCADLSAAFV